MKKYINYVLKLGKDLITELKYTIYPNYNKMNYLLLVSYIQDTLDNYDYRNCFNYNPEGPVKPEHTIFYFMLENNDALLLEDKEPLYNEFDRDNIDSDIIIDENNDYYISLELQYKKYLFDKQLIESFLTKLVKDLNCYD